jgi:hypothetical protein
MLSDLKPSKPKCLPKRFSYIVPTTSRLASYTLYLCYNDFHQEKLNSNHGANMMHIIDTATGEKLYIKNIRSIELMFDRIKKNKESFTLFKGSTEIATVFSKHLDDKQRSKLTSLAEHDIDRRIDKG